jgi:hypothetical protein
MVTKRLSYLNPRMVHLRLGRSAESPFGTCGSRLQNLAKSAAPGPRDALAPTPGMSHKVDGIQDRQAQTNDSAHIRILCTTGPGASIYSEDKVIHFTSAFSFSASRAIFVTQMVAAIVAARPTLRNVQYCQPCFIASPPAATETAALPAVPM